MTIDEPQAAMSSSNPDEIFSLTGPTFLTAVDWNNSHHRQVVAASLVRGVYTLELDRRNKRQGHHALAPPWWEFFHFRPVKHLVDNHDTSYFAVVYQFSPPLYPYPAYSGQKRAPQYVLAFRGTITMYGMKEQDFKLDFGLMFNNHRKSTRAEMGLDTVSDIVQRVGKENVWLAGHSLGSSIALVVGRQMVQAGIHLETYLFNPPFVAPPVEWIPCEKVKIALRLVHSAVTAGVALANSALKGHHHHHGGGGGGGGGGTSDADADGGEPDLFAVLSPWVPNLFVNEADPICCGYLGHFHHRCYMASIGVLETIAKIAMRTSIASIVKNDPEAYHLIPSACLTVNSSSKLSFMKSHGLNQWMKPNLQLKYEFYTLHND